METISIEIFAKNYTKVIDILLENVIILKRAMDMD